MKRFLGLLIGLFLLTGCGIVSNKEDVFKEQSQGDGMKFKNQYEGINLEEDENGKKKYTSLSIDEDNKIVYLNYDEVVKLIKEGTGILYFGRPRCPWCRLLVPSFLEFANDKKVNIYYYDIEADRDANNDQYKEILSLLDKYLPIDTVTQTEYNPDYDSSLKRVVLPHLFFLKNGVVKDEILLYEHEYLKNNMPNEMKELLSTKYKSIE